MAPSRLMLSWGLVDGSEQTRQLQNHIILRHLDIEDSLHQWLRSIAERRNVDGYNSFSAQVQAKQRTGKHTRRSGERSRSIAQIEYLAHIYADRTKVTDLRSTDIRLDKMAVRLRLKPAFASSSCESTGHS